MARYFRLLLFLLILIGGTASLAWAGQGVQKSSKKQSISTSLRTPITEAAQIPVKSASEIILATSSTEATTTSSTIFPPIDRALERITKKPLGIWIDPEHSPVQPDIFTGYHSGVDFEIFPEEEQIDVPITTICSGPLLLKKWASGYGGVAVQGCTLHLRAVTVIYGHLDLASVTSTHAQHLERGQVIGMLGNGFSRETDNRRKHLHLGIHRGSSIELKGYVATEKDLEEWIDARELLR